MKKKYYGVAGVNGYGVYNNYDEAFETKKYLMKFRNKSFDTFEKAKEWAEDTYYELQHGVIYEYRIEEIEKMNWIYYRKKV